eukprot:8074664-Alexandrium_andersonii.AAC.1
MGGEGLTLVRRHDAPRLLHELDRGLTCQSVVFGLLSVALPWVGLRGGHEQIVGQGPWDRR